MDTKTLDYSFNLLDQPWIPISGQGEKSIRDIFNDRGKTLLRLGGTPVEKIVIIRLLLCIVHASNSIKTMDDWKALTVDTIADRALEYLEKWQDRFNLYDSQYPFGQFPQLKGKCDKSALASISLAVAMGNKTVLSQWHQSDSFTDSQRAKLLLSGITYGCGGKKYDKNAKIDPHGPKKSSGSQGTLMGFNGYLHSFMIGKSIIETLHLNLLSENDLTSLNIFNAQDVMGRPFWESMPTDEAGPTATRYRVTYQGILFPLNKFFYYDAQADYLLMTDGIVYPGHKNGQWDPSITLYLDKKDTKAVWTDTEKKPWRVLPSIFQFLNVDSQSTTPVFLIRGLDKLRNDLYSSLGLWVGGIGVNTNSGEQYVTARKDYVESEFTIPLDWALSGAPSYVRYKTMMETINYYSNIVFSSVEKYYKTKNNQQSKDSKKQNKHSEAVASEATRLFWEKMEPLAQEIIDLSVKDAVAVEEADKKWKQIVVSSYEHFCPHITPRQIQAYVENTPNFKRKDKKK